MGRRFLFAVVTIGCFAGPAHQKASAQRPDDEPPPLEAVGSEAFDAIVRFYDYDKSIPLSPRVVERKENDTSIREKFIFRGVRGHLVPGYLELPKDRGGPVPLVLLLHGWSGSKENWWKDGGYISGGNLRRALFDAGHQLPTDYVTHALAWFNAHLKPE